jgi:hypothetical protein
MQCPDENTLVAFTHRLLAAHETATVDSHLRACPECRQIVALLAEAWSTPAPELPRQAASASGAGEPLPLLPERTLSPGTQLGRYILLRPLGVGGMGVVYAAYDSELSRTIALKLLRERQTPSEEARARLQREARAMARLTSPFVLPVYDAGTWNEQVFVTMELVEGGTLTQWLAQRPRGWREVLCGRSWMPDAGWRRRMRRGSSTATSNRTTCWWAPTAASVSRTLGWHAPRKRQSSLQEHGWPRPRGLTSRR